MAKALASKELYDDDGVMKPVIIEMPEFYTFAPGELENDWREATDEELETYRKDYAD